VLFAHQSINPSTHPFINPSIHLFKHISPLLNPSIRPPVHPSTYPSFHKSLLPSIVPPASSVDHVSTAVDGECHVSFDCLTIISTNSLYQRSHAPMTCVNPSPFLTHSLSSRPRPSFLSAPHCHFFHSPFSSFSHFFHLFFFIVPSLHHLIHLQSSPPLKISPHSPPANP